MADSNNLKLSVNLGLQNTYGVFKLNPTIAANKVNIDIYTSGKTYVESEETSAMHAGESYYKEFEGLNPIDSTEWDLKGLGKIYIDKMLTYFMSEKDNGVEGAEGVELYDVDSYNNYKNQFQITFGETTSQESESQENPQQGDSQENPQENSQENSQDQSEVKKYYDYKHNIITITDADECIHKTWGEINGSSYLYGKIKIINLSKYYNVYSIDNTVQSPLLRPLLYNANDLEKYNIGIMNVDNTDIPYIKYLWCLSHFFGQEGGGGTESAQFDNDIYLYDQQNNYFNAQEVPMASTWIEWGEDDDVYDVSTFNTNLGGYPTLRNRSKDWWDNQFPKGFVLFGMRWESDTSQTFNKDGKRSTNQINFQLPSDYRNTFNLLDNTYNFWNKYVKDGEGGTPLLGLVYNGDSVGNIHFINNWFAVTAPKYGQPRQEINYKEDAKNLHPKYIGIVVASVLANIYMYTDSVGNSISYISDIVYLKNYNTLYTKDVIYEASASTQDADETNQLVVFHSTTLKDYVDAVKGHFSDNEKKLISNNNVSAEVKSCIKNVPIQFKMSYTEPGMELVGVKSAKAKVRTIDGKEYDVVLNNNSKEELYQINTTSSGVTADIINSKFKVKYLKSLKQDGNLLRGEFDDTIPEEVCPDICQTFQLDGDQLGFKNTSYTGKPCYSIVTSFNKDLNYTHFVKDEVMVPFAKLF